MTQDNISPEEKLLRLIRGQKKQEVVLPPQAPAVKQQAALCPAERNEAGSRFARLSGTKQRPVFFNQQRIIQLLFILPCLYLFFSFLWPWLGNDKIKLPEEPSRNTAAVTPLDNKDTAKPFDYYLQGASKRQIFKSAYTSDGGANRPESAVNLDLSKDLGLVGIITGANPQAIVEDKRSQRTYYLAKGQLIGDIQVDEILESKIILNYKGQKYELYL